MPVVSFARFEMGEPFNSHGMAAVGRLVTMESIQSPAEGPPRVGYCHIDPQVRNPDCSRLFIWFSGFVFSDDI